MDEKKSNFVVVAVKARVDICDGGIYDLSVVLPNGKAIFGNVHCQKRDIEGEFVSGDDITIDDLRFLEDAPIMGGPDAFAKDGGSFVDDIYDHVSYGILPNLFQLAYEHGLRDSCGWEDKKFEHERWVATIPVSAILAY